MPETLIISRFEYDPLMRERHPEYSKAEYTGTTTNEWRNKFIALNPEQRITAMDIIKTNKFSDTAIAEVLKYYQIQREK